MFYWLEFVSPFSILLHVAFYCGFVSILPVVKEKKLVGHKVDHKRTGSPSCVGPEEFCHCVQNVSFFCVLPFMTFFSKNTFFPRAFWFSVSWLFIDASRASDRPIKTFADVRSDQSLIILTRRMEPRR